MKQEEAIARKFLPMMKFEEINYEPDGNIPPDFSINSLYAVEVRRLNQNIWVEGAVKGLENFSFDLWNGFVKVLESFNSRFDGRTYWVGIEFQRSIDNDLRKLKSLIQHSLEDFLISGRQPPGEVVVNDEVSLLFHKGASSPGMMFKPAGASDLDWGGDIIQICIENLSHCIMEKTQKVAPPVSKYREWWLVLVDHLALALLKPDEFEHVKRSITDFGCFQKVYIVHPDGLNYQILYDT